MLSDRHISDAWSPLAVRHEAMRIVEVDNATGLPEARRGLSETIAFRFTSGQPSQTQRGAMFLHVINHSHRGWVSQMFFEVAAKPTETDLSVYLTRT